MTINLRGPVSTRIAGGIVALGLTAGGFVGAATAPASADDTLASASASPSDNLVSGDEVTVSVSGFPANVTVAGVQCDERVLSGDSTFCDVTNFVIIQTDANGAGTGTFTVKSGEDFASANGMGVCDAKHHCEIALQYKSGDDAWNALASLYFGTETRTFASTYSTAVKQGKKVTVNVDVVARSREIPTGNVVIKDNGNVIKTLALPKSGKVKLSRAWTKGVHKLTVRYGGDTAFLPSTTKLRMVSSS